MAGAVSTTGAASHATVVLDACREAPVRLLGWEEKVLAGAQLQLPALLDVYKLTQYVYKLTQGEGDRARLEVLEWTFLLRPMAAALVPRLPRDVLPAIL